ncbi:MAG: alpha/beta hydrolase [Planctomycetota bacterium]
MLGLLPMFALAFGLLVVGGAAAVLWEMNRPRRKTLGVVLAAGGVGDPADLGLQAEAVTLNLGDGSRSPGWRLAGAEPAGPTVVVVHGHRDSRFGAMYRAQTILPFVREAVVFDLPGHGEAEAVSGKMGAREADDIAAVVAGVTGDPVGPVVLFGSSMGATFVVKAAARHPDLFRHGGGVVALAPYRFWDEGLRGQLRRRRVPAWPVVPMVGLALRVWPGRWGLGERPGFDRAADAAAIGVPLLVVHGDDDAICPLDAGRAIAEAAPRGRLHVVPGGTHNHLLAVDPEAMREAFAAFFAEVAEDSSPAGASPRASIGP